MIPVVLSKGHERPIKGQKSALQGCLLCVPDSILIIQIDVSISCGKKIGRKYTKLKKINFEPNFESYFA